GCMNDLRVRGILNEARNGRKVTNRRDLVGLWVQAYIDGLRPKLEERRLQIRAENKQEIWRQLKTVLARYRQKWALTGVDAAQWRTHFLRTEETEIYAPVRALEDRDIQKALVAQPAARGGNLLVIEPPGPLAIPELPDHEIFIAPNLLTYAELRYRGTAQALETAEMLLPKVLQHAEN